MFDLKTFLLLIDNLSTQCLTHKYVDDTTLTELLTRGSVVSTMQTSFQHVTTVDSFKQHGNKLFKDQPRK